MVLRKKCTSMLELNEIKDIHDFDDAFSDILEHSNENGLESSGSYKGLAVPLHDRDSVNPREEAKQMNSLLEANGGDDDFFIGAIEEEEHDDGFFIGSIEEEEHADEYGGGFLGMRAAPQAPPPSLLTRSVSPQISELKSAAEDLDDVVDGISGRIKNEKNQPSPMMGMKRSTSTPALSHSHMSSQPRKSSSKKSWFSGRIKNEKNPPSAMKRCTSTPALSHTLSSSQPLKSSMKKCSSMLTLNENDDNASQNSIKRNVSFNNIEIREYSQTLGDHPNCSYGPPISLGWDYENSTDMKLEEYEDTRDPRRTKRQMVLSYYVRKNILMNRAGFSQQELKDASKAVQKAKKQRNVTVAISPLSDVEAAVESVGRKVKKLYKSKKVQDGCL